MDARSTTPHGLTAVLLVLRCQASPSLVSHGGSTASVECFRVLAYVVRVVTPAVLVADPMAITTAVLLAAALGLVRALVALSGATLMYVCSSPA